MADPNWDDPCEAAKALRDAYYRLLAGQQESEVTYMGNGVTRTIRYAKTDTQALINELRIAEQDCAAKQGLAPPRRRFAIGAGSRRSY